VVPDHDPSPLPGDAHHLGERAPHPGWLGNVVHHGDAIRQVEGVVGIWDVIAVGHHGLDIRSPLLQLSQHLREGIQGHHTQAEIAQPLRQHTRPRSDVEDDLSLSGTVAKQVAGSPLRVVLDNMRREDRVIDPGNGVEVRLLSGAGGCRHHPAPSRLGRPATRLESPPS
jgi:hypothetical protein